jgi:cell division protein FtsN
MSYDFSFNQKSISFLLGGFAFVGAMLFIAGLLIGVNWKAEPTATANTLASKQPVVTPAPAPEAAPVPKEPVLRADASKREVAEPVDETPSSDDPAPDKKAHSSNTTKLSVDNSRREITNSRRETAPAPVANGDPGELKIIQRAESSANDAAADMLSFSVQVGVFVDESEANQLVRQLQNKGYTPIVLAASDDEGRMWYAVRIGAYANKTEAAQAASNIARQEKIKAVVRPLGSL